MLHVIMYGYGKGPIHWICNHVWLWEKTIYVILQPSSLIVVGYRQSIFLYYLYPRNHGCILFFCKHTS
jgi:hypothetical protein